MIALTAGAETAKPLSQIHVKDIKTFYRKEESVSIMFYCAFPRTALTPDRNTLSLSFKYEKGRADIAWDLHSLRANNLSPWSLTDNASVEPISIMPVSYKKTLIHGRIVISARVGSIRLVRNLSGKEGFPTRFTCQE